MKTERLHLAPLAIGDADFILELLNTPGWLQYIGDRNVHSIEEAEAFIRNGPLASFEQNGYGAYCMTERETGKRIGTCGLYKREGLDHPDLGFAMLPGYEGKGYAMEASQAILDLSRKLDLQHVLAITAKDNQRSIRLLERLGFQWQGYTLFPNDEELNLFHLDLNA